MFKAHLNEKSLLDLSGRLERIAEGYSAKIMMNTMKRISRPAVRTARMRARMIKDTGALAKSISMRGKIYRNDSIADLYIGVRSDFRQGKRRPIKYAHLVEFGFRHRNGRQIQPHPIFRYAFDKHQREIEKAFPDEMERQLVKMIDKLNR